MSGRYRSLFFVLCSSFVAPAVAALCLLPCIVLAQPDARPKLVSIDVGFSGAYKIGCFTPFTVSFLGGTEPVVGVVEFTTADGDGVPVRYVSTPVQLTPGRASTVVGYVKFGQFHPEIKIAFRTTDKVVWEGTIEADALDGGPTFQGPLTSDDRLIVCLGRRMAGELHAATVDVTVRRNGKLVNVTVDDLVALPTRWSGYESVDALVIAPDAPESFAALPADAPQVAAARTWLEQGGRAWLVASTDMKPLLADDAPLGRIVPVRLGDDVLLPRTDALEKLTGRSVKQGIAAVDLKRKPLLVPRLPTDDAIVEATEGDLPLVVRRAVGFGSLLVTSFSPDHALLKTWPGRQAVVRQMLVKTGAIENSELDKDDANKFSQWGYSDLAGQVYGALNQFEGVQVISFFSLAVMVLAYLILIGPVDYFVVRKIFKRTEMTWFTFPTIVLVTSLGAYFLAVWMKGEQIRTNAAEVIDCDAADGVIRGTAYVGVFSPVGRTYDVAVEPATKLLPMTDVVHQTTWLGMPGNGLGGMQHGGGTQWFSRTYGPAPQGGSLVGVPIQVWSSKLFEDRWTARAADSLHAPLAEGRFGRLTGELHNPFSCDVHSALLCYGANAYEIGTLPAGGTFNLATASARDLESVLSGWHIVTSEKKSPVNVARPHDPASQNVEEILQKMMFYVAAGARDNVNLEHRYQSFLDGSALLKELRAVLVGRIEPQHGSTLRLSGADDRADDRRTTFVRLMVPVKPQ